VQFKIALAKGMVEEFNLILSSSHLDA